MVNKYVVTMIVFLSVLVVGCVDVQPSAESVETAAVTDNLEEISRQVGMPFIDDFFEKKMAKQIFELRDNADLLTYCYITNLDGQFVYLGRCVGFGLPYSVQYTNPEKISRVYSSGPVTLPQADPNGLYMPEGLSATWLMLVNEETGEPEIIYTEPSIVVTQSKLPKRLVASWSIPEDY